MSSKRYDEFNNYYNHLGEPSQPPAGADEDDDDDDEDDDFGYDDEGAHLVASLEKLNIFG